MFMRNTTIKYKCCQGIYIAISLFLGMSKFRDNLRRELDFQDVKVKELSKKSGVSKATLECYLRTQATEPSAKNAVRIARALHVSVEYLVMGEEAGQIRRHTALSREEQDIISRIGNLNPEISKAIHRLLIALDKSILHQSEAKHNT